MHAIDTNIWIYSHDKRDGAKQQVAQELIGLTRPLALPWQVGCEFIAACRKLANFGLTQDHAWQSLEAMQAMADCILLPSPKHWSICRELISNHRVSFWDGMLLAACIDGEVKTLFTEDLADGSVIEGTRIVNPFKQSARQ